MTEEEKREARMLYRRSGYRKGQVKILCELFGAPKAEMLKALQGMPDQKEEIRKALLRGYPVRKVAKMYGVSQSTVLRVKRMEKGKSQ